MKRGRIFKQDSTIIADFLQSAIHKGEMGEI